MNDGRLFPSRTKILKLKAPPLWLYFVLLLMMFSLVFNPFSNSNSHSSLSLSLSIGFSPSFSFIFIHSRFHYLGRAGAESVTVLKWMLNAYLAICRIMAERIYKRWMKLMSFYITHRWIEQPSQTVAAKKRGRWQMTIKCPVLCCLCLCDDDDDDYIYCVFLNKDKNVNKHIFAFWGRQMDKWN